ncbi:MAG: hypothetical protein AB1634_05140 [Thermodesulfobacteriota bacterium]
MRFLVLLAALTTLSGPMAPTEAAAPRGIAGLTLGQTVGSVPDLVAMDTDQPIRFTEYLHEVEIRERPGFKTGVVWYGTCAAPGAIVRIKLKYADASKPYFDQLLKRYQERLGKPDEWRGDPFGVVVAWKWSFEEPDGSRISIVLQHNARDEEQKMGNSVKLTATHLLEAEMACHDRHHAAPVEDGRKGGAVAWDDLLPR